jgi:hypothetical protein
MKYWILVCLFIALFVGFAAADTGIDPALEIQGLSTQTIVSAVGGFSHRSDIALQITDDLTGLEGIPPLGDSSGEGSIDVSFDPLVATAQGSNSGAVYYASVYTEDTDTNGLGQVGYHKNLDLGTGAMLTGQSNIEATKQLTYVGENGSGVLSTDFISIDGAANPSPSARFGLGLNTAAPDPGPTASGKFICPFAGGNITPAFCSHVESGSSIDMKIANVATTTNGRFIVSSADTPLALSHDIQVSDSIGKVSAGIEGTIREGRPDEEFFTFNVPIEICSPGGGCNTYDFTGWVGISSTDLYSETTFHDFTSIDGTIVSFEKSMDYNSATAV